MEQEMPDYETIRAAVVSEKWALEKVLACYGEEIDDDLRQTLILKLLEAIPQFPIEKE